MIADKLKSVELSVMFPDDILNSTKIDGLYNDLDVEGKGSANELFMKIMSYNAKLQTKPNDHWIKTLGVIVGEGIVKYNAGSNVLSELRIFQLN